MNAVAAYDRFLGLLAAVVGLMVLASMVFVVVDVLLRYFFDAPIGWVIEVCEYFLLFTPFLGMAWLVRQAEGHIRMTSSSSRSANGRRRRSTAGARS